MDDQILLVQCKWRAMYNMRYVDYACLYFYTLRYMYTSYITKNIHIYIYIYSIYIYGYMYTTMNINSGLTITPCLSHRIHIGWPTWTPFSDLGRLATPGSKVLGFRGPCLGDEFWSVNKIESLVNSEICLRYEELMFFFAKDYYFTCFLKMHCFFCHVFCFPNPGTSMIRFGCLYPIGCSTRHWRSADSPWNLCSGAVRPREILPWGSLHIHSITKYLP